MVSWPKGGGFAERQAAFLLQFPVSSFGRVFASLKGSFYELVPSKGMPKCQHLETTRRPTVWDSTNLCSHG